MCCFRKCARFWTRDVRTNHPPFACLLSGKPRRMSSPADSRRRRCPATATFTTSAPPNAIPIVHPPPFGRVVLNHILPIRKSSVILDITSKESSRWMLTVPVSFFFKEQLNFSYGLPIRRLWGDAFGCNLRPCLSLPQISACLRLCNPMMTGHNN